MKKILVFFLLFLIIISSITACNQTQSVPQQTIEVATEEQVEPTATNVPLSVEVGEHSDEPQIIERNPVEGERLKSDGTIFFTFNQNMNQKDIEEAWTFSDQNNQIISGDIQWQDQRTFIFIPSQLLEPSSIYTGTFTSSAEAINGNTLVEDLAFTFFTEEPITVTKTFPPDGANDVESITSITIIFNRPIVPLVIEEERDDFAQPIQIYPEVSGTGEWINSSVYIFYSDQPLAGGSTYTVTVDQNLEDINGNIFGQEYSWSFITRVPELTQFEIKNNYWSNVNVDEEYNEYSNTYLDPSFRMTFSQSMDQSSVEQALTITNRETGDIIPFQTKWDEISMIITIQPVKQLEINSFYKLNLIPTAFAQNGGQMQEGKTLKFNTLPLPYIISNSAENVNQSNDFRPYAIITFGTPMDFESMEDLITVSPQPEDGFNLAYSEYRNQLSIYGLSPSTEHIIRLLPGMEDIYGNQIKSEYSFSIDVIERPAYANLLLPWTPLVFREQGTQDIYLEYTNLDGGTISVFELSFHRFRELLQNDNDDQAKFTSSYDPLNTWIIDGSEERNEVQFKKIDLMTEDDQPLPAGYYFIGLQTSNLEYKHNFHDTRIFIVSTDNIILKTTATEAFAWVTNIETGTPQENVIVTFYDRDFLTIGLAKTDQDGIAYLNNLDREAVYACLNSDNHVGFASRYWGSGVSVGSFGIWQSYYGSSSNNFGYVYTDRPLYRTGQTVQFEGIVRYQDDLRYSLVDWDEVFVEIEHRGKKVYSEYLSVTKAGNFQGEFDIAQDASLGTYSIVVYKPGPENEFVQSLSFRVAEYHKPEFQVLVSSDKEEVAVGEEITFSVDAEYYAGGNLANATVEWFMESTPYYFLPSSKYQKYNFINWDRDIYKSAQRSDAGNGVFAEGESKTDLKGHLNLTELINANEDKISQTIQLGVNIIDIAGNVVSGESTITAHQNLTYVGVRSQQYIGEEGEKQIFEIVTLDWYSNPITQQSVFVEFFERQWFSVQEEDDQGVLRWKTSVKEIPVAQESVITDENGETTTSFTPESGGVYKILVTVIDENGNQHQASTNIWITGSNLISWRQENDRTFELISDKDFYKPGDTAEFLIAQSFEGENYALITYERGHIYHSEVVLLDNNSTIYQMPITAEMAPITYISVTVINGAEKGGRADFKMSMLPIQVDTNEQTLHINISTDKKKAKPGEDVTYKIYTLDANGDPISANVSLAVVDKSVLALAPPNVEPIVDAFYPKRALFVSTASSIVASADDYNVEFRETTPDGLSSGGGGGDDSQGIVTVRQNFQDTVVFQTNIQTDENGYAEVIVSMPENLTTWQAIVRAVTDDSRVGEATSDLLSTKPLFVNLATPRFFIVGDQVRIGANIHNTSDQSMKVDVELEANGVLLNNSAKQTIEVSANNQAYVFWQVEALESSDRVDLTVHASSETEFDASKPSLGTLSDQGLPIYNYVVQETVGTAGMIEKHNAITEGIRLPQIMDYENVELSINVSPSLVASMVEGLDYLAYYPYQCMEQTVSRFLPNLIVSRALDESGLPSITDQDILKTQINSALQRIYSEQHVDGGWSWWNSGESDPYLTAYVVYGLMEVKETNNVSVSVAVINSGLDYLSNSLLNTSQTKSSWRLNRNSFIIYTLALGGKIKSSQIAILYDKRDLLSTYAKAYLMQTIHINNPVDSRIDTLLADIQNGVIISATGAHWEEEYKDYRNWNTNTRTTAIVINALLQVEGTNTLTANAVRWLMANRELGRWRSTQETTWSLIALTNWMTSSGELDGNYEYAIGLNGDLLQKGIIDKDNLTENINLKIKLDQLLQRELNALVFTRGAGEGNLYYTTHMTANLEVKDIQSLDQGMSISRQYFTIDDIETPITEIEQGELVRVRITMILPGDLHYLVIDDPLPAGFEAIDTTLKTDTKIPISFTRELNANRGWGWWYFEHVELRDEKIILVADYLPAGTYIYTYLTRASTVGIYNVIPPTATEFYFPEVGGRGEGSTFTITP